MELKSFRDLETMSVEDILSITSFSDNAGDGMTEQESYEIGQKAQDRVNAFFMQGGHYQTIFGHDIYFHDILDTKFRFPSAVLFAEEDGSKRIICHSSIMQMPFEIRCPIIAHEVGHIEYGIFYTEYQRIETFKAGSICPAELAADEYAVKLCGAPAVIRSFQFLLSNYPSQLSELEQISKKELQVRIAIIKKKMRGGE